MERYKTFCQVTRYRYSALGFDLGIEERHKRSVVE